MIQLVSGLTRAYRGVGTLIRQSDPLPPFYQARSMLTLEEAGFAKEAATGTDSAMVATVPSENFFSPTHTVDTSQNKGKNSGHRKPGRKSGGGGGRGPSGGHGGRSGGRGGPQPQQQGYPPWFASNQWGCPPWGWASQWASPPCPYPTQRWARSPVPPKQQQGSSILGPGQQNQHAFMTAAQGQPPSSSYTPTDIASAMHTMTLTLPYPSWYMDTGATSHMTSSNGNFSSYFNLSNHSSGIIVENGHIIPICGYGHTSLPSPNPPCL